MKANERYNRIRPLKIWEILQRETDEEHPMGTEELRAKFLVRIVRSGKEQLNASSVESKIELHIDNADRLVFYADDSSVELKIYHHSVEFGLLIAVLEMMM